MLPRHLKRHPTCWLMTDERLGCGGPGDRLFPALGRLPPGSGVVFRHYALPPSARRTLFRRVRRVARARRLLLSVAAPAGLGCGDGVHGSRGQALTFPVHTRREAAAAARAGAIPFVSPVFATRSHPGARPLRPVRAAALAQAAGPRAVALGGMTARRFRQVRPLGFAGWAAIDALG